MTYALLRRARARARRYSGRAEREHRDLEIRLLKLQTIFAGLGVLISALLSAAGIWIGVQLSQASDRERAREIEASRATQADANVQAAGRACLELTMRMRENIRNPFMDAEGLIIKEQIETICKGARINLKDQRMQNEAIERAIGRFVLDTFTNAAKSDPDGLEK
jgi:hypothetical protein